MCSLRLRLGSSAVRLQTVLIPVLVCSYATTTSSNVKIQLSFGLNISLDSSILMIYILFISLYILYILWYPLQHVFHFSNKVPVTYLFTSGAFRNDKHAFIFTSAAENGCSVTMTTTKPLLTVATMMKVTRRFTCRPFRAWPAFANAALLFIYHLVVVYVDFLSLSKLTTKCPKKVKLNMGTNQQ